MTRNFLITILSILTLNVFSQSMEFEINDKILTVTKKYENGNLESVSKYIGKKSESINETNLQSAIKSNQIKLHGELIKYYDNGNVKLRALYKKGTQDHSSYEHLTRNGEKVYTVCETMPKYLKGQSGLFEDISYKMKSYTNKDLKGVIYIIFIVDKNGKITEVECLRGMDSEIDNIAVEIVKSLGDFTPAIESGKTVNCAFNLPIRFE